MKHVKQIGMNSGNGEPPDGPPPERIAAAIEALVPLKYFPSGVDDRRVVMHLLRGICRNERELSWLISTLVNSVGEWPGPAQLRSLLATEFDPQANLKQPIPACTIPGFTPDDMESRAHYARIAAGAQSHAKRLPEPACCSGTGVTDGPPQVTGGPPSYAWCGCAVGQARREREPGYIAAANAEQLKLLHRFGQGAAVGGGQV